MGGGLPVAGPSRTLGRTQTPAPGPRAPGSAPGTGSALCAPAQPHVGSQAGGAPTAGSPPVVPCGPRGLGLPVSSIGPASPGPTWELEQQLAVMNTQFNRRVFIDLFVWNDDQDSSRHIIYVRAGPGRPAPTPRGFPRLSGDVSRA